MTDHSVSKPGIDQLLIASALDGDLRQRLHDTPDDVFGEFDLTAEERDILRDPDQRLLPLLGALLARQAASGAPAPDAPAPAEQRQPHAVVEAQTPQEMWLALTLVPCAQYEDGRIVKVVYAVWVNPLPEGVDPASLPPPPGATFPGQPLAPLHAVIHVSAVQMQGAVGLSASLRQFSNMSEPPPRPVVDLRSDGVQSAIAAVRNASGPERRARIVDLLRILREGDAA